MSLEFLNFIFIAGLSPGLNDPEIDCNGHGPCVNCKERCIGEGYKKGGACLGWPLCCCMKN